MVLVILSTKEFRSITEKIEISPNKAAIVIFYLYGIDLIFH